MDMHNIKEHDVLQESPVPRTMPLPAVSPARGGHATVARQSSQNTQLQAYSNIANRGRQGNAVEGRGKPSLQLKGRAIHDSVVQRVIKIGGEEQANAKVFKALHDAKKIPVGCEMVVQAQVLPVYDKLNREFKTIDDLANKLNIVAPTLQKLIDPREFRTFKQLVILQEMVQYEVKKHPGLFASLVTTAGFEHEFADMDSGSFLSGVSHVKVASSAESMAFSGLPFHVETDASNALELVSPPFLFPTLKGEPIPLPEIVGAVDNLIQATLLSTVGTPNPVTFNYWQMSIQHNTIGKVLDKLSEKTGLTFKLNKVIQLDPANISHNADLKEIGKHLSGDAKADGGLKFNPAHIQDIAVGLSYKSLRGGSYVGSQLNIATDVSTILALSQLPKKMEYAPLFQDVQAFLTAQLPVPDEKSAGLKQFHSLMIPKFASLFAVPSQEHMQKKQQEWHQRILGILADPTSKAATSYQKLATGSAEYKEFELHAAQASFVKDAQPVWIKDHLVSLAFGILDREDYPLLIAYLKKHVEKLNKPNLPGPLAAKMIKAGHQLAGAHWQGFTGHLLLAYQALATALEQKSMAEGADAKSNAQYYAHDSKIVGARQGTYADPRNVQMPQIWNRRLHVAEIRRGKPADALAAITGPIPK
jgi:hypothetical protein